MRTPSYKDASFGMALARMNYPPGSVQDFSAFHPFDAIEFPAESIFRGDPCYPGAFRRLAFQHVHSGGLLDFSLSENIPGSPPKLRKEFAYQADAVLRDLADRGVKTASLDCSLDSLAGNPDAVQSLLDILKLLAHTLVTRGMTLLIPYRIPSDAEAEFVADFLRRTMIPQVRLRLDVHPHELPRDFAPETILRHLKPEIGSVIWVYDADSGNRILKKHLTPWLDVLLPAGMNGPFLFCPNSRRNRMALAEAEAFLELVTELRN